METEKVQTNLCIKLSVKKLGIRRSVAATRLKEEADEELLHVSKDIIDSKALRPLTSILSAAKSHVRDHRAFPVKVLRGGIYPLPLMLMDEVDEYLRKTDDRVRSLAYEFAHNDYAAAKTAAEAKLGPIGLFDETEYPSVSAVERAFGLKWSFLTISVPEEVKSVSAAIYARENAKLEAEYEGVRKEMRAILRAQAAQFVAQLKETLTDVDGKAKKIRASVGAKLSDFCAVFPFRNVDDDKSLTAEVERIRDLLTEVDAEKLRSDAMLRSRLAFEFDDVHTSLAKLVEEAPVRKFNLTEVDHAAA